MKFEIFDTASTQIQPGINLIEASAGTGKTYTIAMLVSRFVVEMDTDIKSLLVVTFTKAATEELKARIRARLVEIRQHLDGHKIDDPTIVTWLNQLSLDPLFIREKINLALADVDQADIFTIHGFCQRILTEHALESGQLFDCELSHNIDPVIQECADDFWRQQLYQRSPFEVSILTKQYATPEALLNSIGSLENGCKILPETVDISDLFEQLNQQITLISQSYEDILATINNTETGYFKKAAFENLPTYEAFTFWTQGQSPEPPDFSSLTEAGLEAAINGSKLRKEEKRQEFLKQLNIDTVPFDCFESLMQQICVQFRINLYHYLQHTVINKLQQLNRMSFDDLITKLYQALQGNKGNILIQSLKNRYQAAFIDEFQDTDQQQWHIFSTLFSHSRQSVFLIGDPKQAIYKFRGADIHSYFAAQSKAHHHYTLNKNWRSNPRLVQAINQLFNKPQAFLFEQLSFNVVSPGRTEEQGRLLDEKSQTVPPLVLWQLDKNSGNLPYWSVTKASDIFIQTVVNESLKLLNKPYKLALSEQKNPVKPSDIAILVRDHAQALAYQQAFISAGIPAIVNSKESVFHSQEAKDIYTVLLAIEQPGHLSLLKQALSVPWFNLDGQQFYQLAQYESLLDHWINRFQDYYHLWQQKGLMTMMKHLFSQKNVATHLAHRPQPERTLTNLNHVIELLQQAILDQHLSMNKTLDWLHQGITSKHSAEDCQLRLESDDDAVKIITLHSAKGLEYPIVFCPQLWQRKENLKKQKELIKFHQDGQIWLDFGSEQFEKNKQQALQEELAEDIRLLYVAVTRAKYRCYISWADVRTKNEPNQSALASLLELADKDFAGQQSRLQHFALESPEYFDYQLVNPDITISGHYQLENSHRELQARTLTRELHSHWQMSSYTALSALSIQDVPELPLDKANEPDEIKTVSTEESLPKGMHTGNVLHELLEKISFQNLAEKLDISQQRDSICRKYNLSIEQPEIIDNLLQTVVNTPLSEDTEFKLANINDKHCIKEMPFYLSMKEIDISQINNILADCPTFQPLNSRRMAGFLTGFIDLICQYQGRFYLMDYKSNSLDDYHPESLTQAMKEHNYGLQYWIYSLVLHQYLQQRLPDYDYPQHFGGVKYLFLRGMHSDQPESGVYSTRPEYQTLQQLISLFN